MATTALILYLQRTLGSPTAVGLLLVAQAIPPVTAPFDRGVRRSRQHGGLRNPAPEGQQSPTEILTLHRPLQSPGAVNMNFSISLVEALWPSQPPRTIRGEGT
jgi:hypothetical protein